MFNRKFKSFLFEFKRLVLVVAGGALMAMNINTFVHSANLFPGGFTGLSLLIQGAVLKFTGRTIPYSALVFTFNIFPVIIGFRFIGRKFTIYSVVMIVVSGFLTDLIPGLNLTDDVLLCSIFGGILNAIAVGLCLFAGSSSGGTDFIAIWVSERTGESAWNFILAGNVCVLAVAGVLFGWNAALYSIIFQFVSTQALGLIYKKYDKITLLVITDHSQEVYEVIRNNTNHDATVFEGKGCFKGIPHQMVYSVVSAQESGLLEKEIFKADPNAFINVLHSKGIVGRFFKRAHD